MFYAYPVAAPDLSGNELEYVVDCMKSTWISSSGPYLDRFEKQVAAASGVEHGIATSNGTVALHLALLALGLQPGDEVIVPSLTFVATANAVTYCGAVPVFADCDPQTWCISNNSVNRLLTPRTKGIIPVHLFGHPCDMDPLMQIARSKGLWVLEDCAEAIGAQYKGQPVGSFGDAAAFSFFGNKIITTGEGGMVVCRDPELASQLRLLRGQGMNPQRRYWHEVLGYNYRLTNLAAAVGTAQMERFEQLTDQRRRLAKWYSKELKSAIGTTTPIEARDARSAFWMYSVLLESPEMREHVRTQLGARGIETRPFFYPNQCLPMYQMSRSDEGCAISCDVSSRGLSLPSYSCLEQGDVQYIASEFRRAAVSFRGSTGRRAAA